MTGGAMHLRRGVLVAALAALGTAQGLGAQAPDRVMETDRTPRRYLLPLVGAAVGGLASLTYFWSGPRTLPGTCSGPTCVAVVSVGGGAFIGWLVGREKDQLHEIRYRGGKPLRPTAVSVTLTGDPIALALTDSLVAAIGGGGVQVVSSTTARPQLLSVRAAGLRSVNDAVFAGSEIALSASGGFYRFPVAAGQGVQLRGPPAGAVAVLGSDFIVAAGTRVERVARTASDTSRWPGVALGDSVRALTVDERGLVWAATTAELVALRPAFDSLAVVSRTPLPRGVANRVNVSGPLAAVALGDSGVRFIGVADPSAPRVITDWRGVRFALDVAIGTNGRIFVAAGIDGLAVATLTGSNVRLEGLARELGFIYAVAADARHVWALDRSGSPVIRRIPIDF